MASSVDLGMAAIGDSQGEERHTSGVTVVQSLVEERHTFVASGVMDRTVASLEVGDSKLVAVLALTSQTYSSPCWHYTTNQSKVAARSTAMVATMVFASKAAVRNPSLEVVAAAHTT